MPRSRYSQRLTPSVRGLHHKEASMSNIEIDRTANRAFRFVFNGVATLGALLGGFLGLLGYWLYTTAGVEQAPGQLEAKSNFLTIVLSGKGPGLLFMGIGGIVIIVAIIAAAMGREVGQELRSPRSARVTRKRRVGGSGTGDDGA